MGVTGLVAGTQYWLAKTLQIFLGTSHPKDDVTRFFNVQLSAGFTQAPIILVAAIVLVHFVAWKVGRSVWQRFYPPETVSFIGVGLLVSAAAEVYSLSHLLW